MDAVMGIIKKVYYAFVKLPIRMRLLIMASFFIILFVASVNIKQHNNDGEKIYDKSGQSENNHGNNSDSSDDVDEEENSIPVPKEVKVVIDPGHGGEDLGATKGDLYEKKLNLDISKKLGKILKGLDINVVYTREEDVDVGLDERVNIANRLDATLFISVHNNYMPNDAGYKGTETLYCPPVNAKEDKLDGMKLAAIVQKRLVNGLNTVDNGIIYRPNLVVLRKTNMPAVIAEIAYMSNSSDRSKLMDDGFRQKAAKALAEAVMESLEFMKAEKNEEGKWMIMD